ncbi:MAG: hypothetical protein K2P57_13080 [Burkholderiales bacterium]|nr:hypothetical protein [Burkholderiales bacterium]
MNGLFDEMAQLVARKIGLHIPDEAQERFMRDLREHAARRGHADLEDYLEFLAGTQAAGEWEEFARAFTSRETFFFRDHGQFDLLRLRLLPELMARNDRTLRLWSAGCASGEEAYSLAMLVDMLLPERSGWNILILGTDIDSEAIARARHGHYGKWSFRMVPPELRQRYFNAESGNRSEAQSAAGNQHVLDERIRSMVTFRVSNLVSEAFPAPWTELHDMDLILCRNVFIYFDRQAVSEVASKFAATLREGGYLLTAHTELIGYPVRELEPRLFAEGVAYRKHAAPCPAPIAPLFVPMQPAPLAAPAQPHGQSPFEKAVAHADRGEFDLAEQACREALAADPLAAAPYFLLAQLAEVREDFGRAKECLNKAIYLDPCFVAAYLELAVLYERAEDVRRAGTLRRAALDIVRSMPCDAVIAQYGVTAGELKPWLEQWA